jgi:diadenosine tetraphosphate (Ap4A) HIT family hydrolase
MTAACVMCEAVAGRAAHLARLADLGECVAFLNDQQGCRGWCVLVLRTHEEHLGGLSAERQRRVFGEVSLVAGAIREVFATSGRGGGPPRINYECLGNVTAHVHWHVIPRHADDPAPGAPVWGWEASRLRGAMSPEARATLAAELSRRIVRG